MEGGRLGISGTQRITESDVLQATISFLMSAGIIAVIIISLLVISQIVVFSVVNFKCRKFRRRTVKENFNGMKTLGIVLEALVIVNVIMMIMIIFDTIPTLVNEWGYGEFNAVTLIIILLSCVLLGYGIFTWINFIRSKRLYDHMFPKVVRKTERKLYDSVSLFGDSKDPLEEQAKRKTEEKEIQNIHNIQKAPDTCEPSEIISINGGADNIIIPEAEKNFMPSASDTVKKACPLCGYLNAEGSDECVFCGAEIK